MRDTIRYKILALAIMLTSTGCSVTDPLVGTGPIAMGPAAEKAFTDYRAKSFPRYFALSEDGSSFYYSFCSGNQCPRTPKSQIVRQCETYSAGIPCKIYARNGEVVWANDI